MTDKEIKKWLLGQGETVDDIFTSFETKADRNLFQQANIVKEAAFGRKVYQYALVNFSNFCKRSCHYCSLYCGNSSIQRYRMSVRQILDCLTIAYMAGYRSFILQSGDDDHYSDELLVQIIESVKDTFADSEIFLDLGERARKSYKALFDAGARGYILNIETSAANIYKKTHDHEVVESRIVALYNLRDVGFDVASGFMVGLPGQTADHIVRDIHFVRSLQPKMFLVCPYIRSAGAVIKTNNGGTLLTLRAIALARLVSGNVIIPAVSQLDYLSSSFAKGVKNQALLSGANAIVKDFTPEHLKNYFLLYEKDTCDIFF